jgi:hypothetical protein
MPNICVSVKGAHGILNQTINRQGPGSQDSVLIIARLAVGMREKRRRRFENAYFFCLYALENDKDANYSPIEIDVVAVLATGFKPGQRL